MGLCRLLSGRDELISTFPWPFVDSIVYSLPLSALVLVVVSWLTPKLNAAHIRRCFR